MTETNSTLEATISAQSEEINILKSDLSEKDRLYQFLLTEYSEMCSNVASRVSDANAEPI